MLNEADKLQFHCKATVFLPDIDHFKTLLPNPRPRYTYVAVFKNIFQCPVEKNNNADSILK